MRGRREESTARLDVQKFLGHVEINQGGQDSMKPSVKVARRIDVRRNVLVQQVFQALVHDDGRLPETSPNFNLEQMTGASGRDGG